MSELKMEQSDVGEMLGIILAAKEAEFGKVQIDTLDAEEVVGMAYYSFALTEHNRLLQLENEQLAQDKAELFEAFNALKEIALDERKWRLEDCEELCHLEIDESLSILSGRINSLLEKHKCD